MNPVAKEIASYMGSAQMTDKEFLEHYGMPRRSGRYPWGSGEDPYQHGQDFLSRVDELKKTGWKETTENIKKEFGMNSTQYRREKMIATEERRLYQVSTAKSLREDGLNNSEIARKMGTNESTVRGWLNQDSTSKLTQTRELANQLKKLADDYRMVDVGAQVNRELNVSRERLDTALYMLQREGYHVYGGGVPQVTNKGQQTNQKVLAKPDVKHGEIYDYDKVHTIKDYISRDGGQTLEKKFTYPSSLDSKRIQVRYKEDGGEQRDGLIELRRGVPDLSLGDSRYAQVRILVDGTHYMKGMAVYSDDLPPGVDVIFNTNKSKSVSKMDTLKKIKNDPENPFGSNIKDADQGGQYWYDPKTGKRVSANDTSVKNKKLGLINKRADEGDWTEWADKLPSQFLSKQSNQLAKKQLDLAKAEKTAELDEIMQLNNPVIKKYYLNKFASNCDAAAVDLKAAALPGQKYHVMIPINTLKDNEVYAPQYEQGSKLALIRYPHGGTFEIPILTVNNKNPDARRWIGVNSIDAVGVNKHNADRLSGADFDGDTVMCIPTHDRKGKVRISSQKELPGLKGFDPKFTYGPDPNKKTVDKDGNEYYYRGDRKYKAMNDRLKQKEMGVVSNLITDMTLAGATNDELARAVRHSMVVIDAEKHHLDYKQSEIDNNIAALKKIYQPKYNDDGDLIGYGGASTIISKAKGVQRVDKRRGQPKINVKDSKDYDPTKPEGSLLYNTAYDKDLYYVESTYNKQSGIRTVTTTNGKKITYNMNNKAERDKYDPVMTKDSKTGKVTFKSKDGTLSYRTNKRTQDSTKMAETDDAMTLVSKSRHPMELLYADYANSMKALANKARIELVNTKNLQYNPTAKKVYQKEVSSLNSKLNDALKNAVKERQAGRLAAAEIKRIQEADPSLTSDDIKKLSQRSLSKYREEVGSVSRRKRAMIISDKEWEAIQAGAISNNKLEQILNNSDPDVLRERAMPKSNKGILSTAQINRIKRMDASNFTIADIAKKMNLSPSTISKYLKGVK